MCVCNSNKISRLVELTDINVYEPEGEKNIQKHVCSFNSMTMTGEVRYSVNIQVLQNLQSIKKFI